LGVRGTGWFLSPTSMATVEHVAAGMNLSDQSWKQVEIRTGENRQSIAVRIRQLVGTHAEKIAVLELQTAFAGAQGFELRMNPLVADEAVVSLAYPGDQLRIAGGRFVQYGDDGRFAGTALLEMYDGNDRLVLDHGASGARIRLRGPNRRGRQQPVHDDSTVHVTCDTSLDGLGKSQRGFGAGSIAEGFFPRPMTRRMTGWPQRFGQAIDRRFRGRRCLPPPISPPCASMLSTRLGATPPLRA
jgi:hypothetical protein